MCLGNQTGRLMSLLKYEELTHQLVMIEKKNHPSIFERGIDLDIFNNDINIVKDW